MHNHWQLKQGDIIYVSFDPARGHEERKQRPAVVISNNFYNSKTWMKKVLPITSTESGFPLHVVLPDGLPVTGELMLEQERAMDLSRRSFDLVGRLPQDTLEEVLDLVHDTY